MGLKKLAQIRSYWKKRALFGCCAIKSIMTRDRFEAILRFIHLVDNQKLVQKGSPGYDKLDKVRWLLEDFVRINHPFTIASSI